MSSSGIPSAPPPPQAPGYFLVGSIPDYLRDLLGALLKGWRSSGDVVRFKVPQPMVLVVHPDGVQHVLEDHYEGHPRSWIIRDEFDSMLHGSSFNLHGAAWRTRSRILRTVYGEEQTARFARLATERAEAMLERWERELSPGAAFDIQPECIRLSLETVGSLTFGDDWERGGEAICQAFLTVWE